MVCSWNSRRTDHADFIPREPDEPDLTADEIESASISKPLLATMSVTEAVRVLGISRTTAHEAVRDGSLRSIRLRRRIVISRAWVIDVLNGRTWLEVSRKRTDETDESALSSEALGVSTSLLILDRIRPGPLTWFLIGNDVKTSVSVSDL
jgi:excisionase family DNA binding protein